MNYVKITKVNVFDNPDAAIHDLAVVLLGQKMNFIRTRASLVKMIDYGSQVLLSTLDFQGESVL